MSTVAEAPQVAPAEPDPGSGRGTPPTPPIAKPATPTALADLPALDVPRTLRPSDAGRRMAFEDFILCDFEDGCFYELARGIIVVAEVPGIEHGFIEQRTSDLFAFYNRDHPGLIRYRAHGSGCRLRLPGMQTDRHPDFAAYLTDRPVNAPKPWSVWVPDLVVEIVSPGGEERDFVEKREEYLRAGVREYWILNPATRVLHALQRAGDTWQEQTIVADALYRCPLLPGLEVRPADLFGAADPA